MRLLSFIGCLLFFAHSCAEQSGDALLLTPDQMREDVAFMYGVISKTHPNPYQVLSRKKYERQKRKILNSVKKPMNVYDFWVTLARLHPFFDAHTSVAPPKDIVRYLSDEAQCAYFTPGTFLVRDSTFCFGVADGIPDSLKRRQIVSINRRPAHAIMQNMAKYISHESPIAVRNCLEGLLSILYPLLYHKPQRLDIKYADDNGKIKEVRLTLADFKYWNITFRRAPYLFRYNREEKMALFELNTFTGAFEAYGKAVAQAVDSLHRYDIQHLFIDVSVNGGGEGRVDIPFYYWIT